MKMITSQLLSFSVSAIFESDNFINGYDDVIWTWAFVKMAEKGEFQNYCFKYKIKKMRLI